MTRLACITAAVALMAASSAAANGYVGLKYGNAEPEAFGTGLEVDLWQGEGAFGWLGGNWGGQIGGSFGTAESDGGDDADVWTLNGHLYWRSGAWRLGGVVATSRLDPGGAGEAEDWAYGLEGMFDLGPSANIFASATVGEADFFGDDLDTWNLDFGGNFYAGPDVRLGAMVGVGNLEESGADVDTTSYGLNGEFKPWSAPVSITAGWNFFEIEDTDFESSTFQIGARWNFGGGTLQERNNLVPFATTTGLTDRFWGIY